MRWKHWLPASVMSDAVGYMAGQLAISKYPEKIKRILYRIQSPAGLLSSSQMLWIYAR